MIQLNKKTVWTLVCVLILVGVSWLLLRKGSPADMRKGKRDMVRSVDAVVVQPELMINELTVTGSLLANDEVELKNEVAGRIVHLNLPEGRTVSKGTVLVRLFNDDLLAGLKKYQAQLALQEQLAKRQSELVKINGISQNEYEQTMLQVSNLKAEIEEQKAQIRKTEVLAPFDGIVGLRNVSVGAVVNSSTVLAILRSAALKLDFYVPEKYAEVVKAGMKVSFSLSNGTQAYDAVVHATERGIENTTRSLKVRALLNKNTAGLNPGTFANVRLRIGENSNAILIPAEALIPMERNQQVVVSKHGKASFVQVVTGVRKESKVEIISGLSAGDTVVTSGLMFIKDGAPLQFSNVKSAL
jgi:membrane fusion protein, multidrug efflux system